MTLTIISIIYVIIYYQLSIFIKMIFFRFMFNWTMAYKSSSTFPNPTARVLNWNLEKVKRINFLKSIYIYK